eukprot:2633293-Amphidinium_carterae.1
MGNVLLHRGTECMTTFREFLRSFAEIRTPQAGRKDFVVCRGVQLLYIAIGTHEAMQPTRDT